MDLFGINKRVEKRIQAMLISSDIQGMRPEAERSAVELTSLLTGRRIGGSIQGLQNEYTTYDSQVDELYKKYNGESEWGCAQTRSLIDIRSAFISGEGLSVSCKDEKTSEWIEEYIDKNKLNGLGFVRMVKGGEFTGQQILTNNIEGSDKNMYVKIKRVPYYKEFPYNYIPKIPRGKDFDDLVLFAEKNRFEKIKVSYPSMVYVPIGGDDILSHGPTPKIGVVLTDLENYDRALKDMRRNNHILARITPTFETKTEKETTSLISLLKQMKWKIGKAFIGSAKLEYKTPGQGCHENLKTEMVATLKTISAVSGMPVHWLGYVDLMSNRSTADSLYEFINNATLSERIIWQTSIYDLIIKAQEMYIDAGGKNISKVNTDFEVKIPLIDYSNFLDKIRALSMAFNDNAITMDDYRNGIPGIDPLKTKRQMEEEEKNEIKKLKSKIPKPGMVNKEEEGEEDDE